MTGFPFRGLYAITDGPRPDLQAVAAAALRGGARALQYRDNTGDAGRRQHEVRALKQLCVGYGVPLVVDQDVLLAQLAGADGVHLADPAHVGAARARLGGEAIIGVACRDSITSARAAVAGGASYVSFGAFFPSPTLPGARLAPLDLLRQSAGLGVPRVAIGGVTPDNGRRLLDAGADVLAAISAVFSASAPVDEAHRFARLFPLENDHEQP